MCKACREREGERAQVSIPSPSEYAAIIGDNSCVRVPRLLFVIQYYISLTPVILCADCMHKFCREVEGETESERDRER